MKGQTKTKPINSKAVAQHSRKIFAISQTFPASVINLLSQKRKRELTQKQQRQIYQQIKQKNIFPIVTNPKTLIQFCSQLSLQIHKLGKLLQPNNHCYVVLDGAIKIFELVKHSHQEEEHDPTYHSIDLQAKHKHQKVELHEDIRMSVSNFGFSRHHHTQKIQKQKITIGEVLLFDQENVDLLYEVSSSVVMLKIPYNIYYTISLATFMVQIKKKQQFFNKISLFQRHYRSSLQDFVNSLQQITCGFGKKIFAEGSPVDSIYIVKEGQFILQKNVFTDDLIVKQGKVTRIKTQGNQSYLDSQIKNSIKHYRACPYKIIGQKQILGDCQYLFNNKAFIHSMRCHKQGSRLYKINADLYFKKLYVSQNGVERANKILQQNYQIRKKQIEDGVKFNQSNILMLKFMPNKTLRHITSHTHSKDKHNNDSIRKLDDQKLRNSTQRSVSFFQQMNKTIINQHKNSIRKRNQSRNLQIRPSQLSRKVYKTPAVVQQVVQIVNQKRAYHKLRNMGMQKKNAFQFDINNVPPFIKKKYGRILEPKNK